MAVTNQGEPACRLMTSAKTATTFELFCSLPIVPHTLRMDYKGNAVKGPSDISQWFLPKFRLGAASGFFFNCIPGGFKAPWPTLDSV